MVREVLTSLCELNVLLGFEVKDIAQQSRLHFHYSDLTMDNLFDN